MQPKRIPSADDAPLGSVIRPKTDPLTIRYPDGRGWHLLSSAHQTTRRGWLWKEHDISGPVYVIAEGLTEDECYTLSGMSAADAALWCERRSTVMLQDNPCADALRLLGWNGEGDPRDWAKEMVADRRREFFRALDDWEVKRDGIRQRHKQAVSVLSPLIGRDIGTDGWRREQALWADKHRPRQSDIGGRVNSSSTYNNETIPRIDIKALDEAIKDAAARRLDAIEKMLRTLQPGQSLAVHDGQHDDTRMEMLVLEAGDHPPLGKTLTVYGPAPQNIADLIGTRPTKFNNEA